LAFWWWVCCGVAPFAHGDWTEERTALDRQGVHHAGFVLRVEDYLGEPVETEVSIHATAPGWGGPRSRLAATRTDATGTVRFDGISSRHPLVAFVAGSDDLRPRQLALPGVSNGVVDLGVATLERNFIVTGVLYQNDALGRARPMEHARVALRTRGMKTARHGPLPGEYRAGDSDPRDGVFRLANFDPGSLEIYISWYSRTHSRSLRYAVPFEFDPNRRHRHFLLTLPREDAPDQTVVVEEGSWPAGVPSESDEERGTPHRVEGRIAVNGRPLAGLPIRGGFSTTTDADGRFVADRKSASGELVVLTPSGDVRILSEDAARSRREWRESLERGEFDYTDQIMADLLAERVPPTHGVALDRPFEVTLEVLGRLTVRVEGESADRITTSWLHHGEWIPTSLDQLGLVLGRREEQTFVRAVVPGRLTRLVAYPPREAEVRFDFSADEPHGLLVVDDGEPVAGATVEVVESPTTLAAGLRAVDDRSTVLLNRVSTDADGRIELLGDPDAVYVAYVYAGGFEPRRVRLLPGVVSLAELAGRTVEVRFEGLRPDELLRVKVAGRDGLAAAHRAHADGGAPFTLPLAPGTYDVTVQQGPGIVRGNTIRVPGQPPVVDLAVDARPILAVRFPDLPGSIKWQLSASRTTPAGSAHGAVAASYRTTLVTGEPPARTERDDGLVFLRLPGTGRWQVYASSRGVPHSFFTEVDLVPGERRVLEMPNLDATLEGSMTYRLDPGDHIAQHHGVASPRMILLAAGGAGSGWNMVLDMPESDDDVGDSDSAGRRRFEITRLPAGDYGLFHHLTEYRYRGDRPIWGGTEVTLHSGRTTTVAGLDAADPGTLLVEVVDAQGRPVHGGMLRIRDRMHEAWAAFTDIPTTAAGAPDPIPLPPAARLTGEPVAFRPVRAGPLELVLDDPAGTAKYYLREVEPGTTLRLVLDP